MTVVNRLSKEKAEALAAQLKSLGANAQAESVVSHNWPKPYDELTNPLSINLTAFNTFVLICSSVTMVLSLCPPCSRGNEDAVWLFCSQPS